MNPLAQAKEKAVRGTENHFIKLKNEGTGTNFAEAQLGTCVHAVRRFD